MKSAWQNCWRLLQQLYAKKYDKQQIRVGIDWTENSVTVVALKKNTMVDSITGVGFVDFSQVDKNASVKIAALQQACLQAGVTSGAAIIAVSDQFILQQSIQLPKNLNAIEIELHLLMESERYFNLPGNMLYFDFDIKEDCKSSPHLNQINVIAIPKKMVDPQLEILSQMGLSIVAVDLKDIALARAFSVVIEPAELSLIVQCNECEFLTLLMHQGNLLHHQRESLTDVSLVNVTKQITQQYQWLQLLQAETISQIWLSGRAAWLKEVIDPVQEILQIRPRLMTKLPLQQFVNAEVAEVFNANLMRYWLSYGLSQW